MSLALRYLAHSEIGLVRKNNQDSAYTSPTMLVVADGMGGGRPPATWPRRSPSGSSRRRTAPTPARRCSTSSPKPSTPPERRSAT